MPNRTSSLVVLALVGSLACASRGSRPPETAIAGDTAASIETTGKTLEQLFAGRTAGVDVRRAANGGISIRIRGASSFMASEEPLYVIDDNPITQRSGGIFFMNPNDIEQIEVLKNPADIALYGMRGANGVVRITTKRPR